QNLATKPPTPGVKAPSVSEATVKPQPPVSGAASAKTQVSANAQATVKPPAKPHVVTPVRPAPAQASAPVASAQQTNLDVEATQSLKTRMASAEEIAALKKVYSRQQRNRLTFWVAFAAVFFAFSIACYITMRPQREEIVTWPTDANGDEEIDFVQTAPYLASVFPQVPGSEVTQDGGNAEVFTRLGKLRDVPLHLLISTWKNQDELTKSHGQSFFDWIATMRQKHPEMNFNGEGRIVFINVTQGAGVPVTVESYTRRVGNDDFFGVLGYLRHADNVHLTLAEVPLSEQWRCEMLLRERIATNFVVYAIKRTANWWEGSSHYRQHTSIDKDLEEAGRYQRRGAPALWEKIHLLTKSALIKAAQSGDEEAQNRALEILRRLRSAQAAWYNTQKLAYQYAAKNEDKETMRSIQAMSESIFSSEFKDDDYRYDYIRRKFWE
ncbi:MAG: hypothetical protein J6866_05870, partial [Victivallales bacterium]|nr:hypothetical protein [Victivallales bacterium]